MYQVASNRVNGGRSEFNCGRRLVNQDDDCSVDSSQVGFDVFLHLSVAHVASCCSCHFFCKRSGATYFLSVTLLCCSLRSSQQILNEIVRQYLLFLFFSNLHTVSFYYRESDDPFYTFYNSENHNYFFGGSASLSK